MHTSMTADSLKLTTLACIYIGLYNTNLTSMFSQLINFVTKFAMMHHEYDARLV